MFRVPTESLGAEGRRGRQDSVINSQYLGEIFKTIVLSLFSGIKGKKEKGEPVSVTLYDIVLASTSPSKKA